MSKAIKKSRVGFVVIKLIAAGRPYYLMRSDKKWSDVTFIGGHEEGRDAGKLERTARRELWEEVPSIRDHRRFRLEALTEEMCYGPTYSRSRGVEVEYELQFFLLKIFGSPELLVKKLGPRSKNVWVTEKDLLERRNVPISNMAKLLFDVLPGGARGIPLSSATDLEAMLGPFALRGHLQLEFRLH